MDLISVIIPVYNVEAYLQRCIESVMNQTYCNLEIILVDDGSTDGSSQLCDKYVNLDQRFRVLHKKNAGVGEARNDGLKMSTGEYIAFLDPDDWIDRDMYSVLMTAIQEENAQAAFCSFYRESSDAAVEKKPDIPQGKTGDSQDAIAKCFDVGYGTMIWNKIFSRELLLNEKNEFVLFRKDLKCGEDQLWLMEILCKTQKAVYVPKHMYHWRIRAGSAYRDVKITNTKLQDVMVQEMSLKYIDKANTTAYKLAMGRLYAKAYEYMVLAYIQGEKQLFEQIKEYADRYRKDWWDAEYTSVTMKIKRVCIEAAIKMKLSKGIVAFMKKL